jgi:hypothetical protein
MFVAAQEPLPGAVRAGGGLGDGAAFGAGHGKDRAISGDARTTRGRAELAQRLRWHLPQVNRVLDLRHASQMEQVEAALAALGCRRIVDVARAA